MLAALAEAALMPTRAPTVPGPCRLCGGISYRADGEGPAHGCCLAWRRVIAAGQPCPACQIAGIIARQPKTWPDGTTRQVRLPVLPPLPQVLPDGSPFAPEPQPVDPEPCGVPNCEAPGRFYACGWRCAEHKPALRKHLSPLEETERSR